MLKCKNNKTKFQNNLFMWLHASKLCVCHKFLCLHYAHTYECAHDFLRLGVVLELWLVRFLNPIGPKLVFRPQILSWKVLNTFWWIHWIHIEILVKMRFCLWKLKLGFTTYYLVSLLGWIGSKWVIRHQVPSSGF